MTEAEMNARARADPYWFMQYALTFMALCLKHYEDALRNAHAELLAQSRAHPDEFAYAYANPRFYGGTDFMGNWPLFWDGGLPRYFGAVGDLGERNRLFNELSASERSIAGRSMAYRKLASLHRRMFHYYRSASHTPWQQIQQIYRMFHMYASGSNDRAEMLGFGIAGAATGIAGFASRLGAMRRPGPVGAGRTTLPGMGPEPVGSGRRTLPGIGPGPEDIGHARTEPGGRVRGPAGIRDTIEDVQSSSTLPGPPRNTAPPPADYEQIVRTTATEVGGASGRGGRLIEPLTRAAAQALDGNVAGSVAYYFPEGNFEARQSYAQSWRDFGGTGSPPEHGFVVRNASGETELIALTFRPQRTPNARLAPMTAQQRDGILRANMVGSNHYQGQTGYEFYVSDWRAQGGQGPPPEFGFLIKQPDGSVARAVGFYPEGLGPGHLSSE